MSKTKQLAISLIFLFLSSFIGCGNKENIQKVDLNKTEDISATFQEASGIRIGIIPEQDIRSMAQRYEPLAEYLEKKLNMRVTLVYLDNYGEVCDKFIYKQLDAAFFGSFSYALTHVKSGVEPILRPDYSGTSTYRGLVIVRNDSGIKNIADMKNKKLALVHQATYAGYLYPLYYFKEHAVNKLEEYFSGVLFTGSHDKAIFALLREEVDIAATKDLVYQRIIKENPELEKKLTVLSASQPVPSNALCVSKELGAELKDKLRSALLGLNNDPEGGAVLESLGGAARFIETQDEDYHYLYEVIKALGIDLDTYPYYKRQDMGFERTGQDG